MISRVGPAEILLVLGVALLVFGPSRLPEIGKSFGKGLREFRQATREITDTVKDAVEEEKP